MEALGGLELTRYEKACYAMARHESAVTAMGNEKLQVIAAELIRNVRATVRIDGTCGRGRGRRSR